MIKQNTNIKYHKMYVEIITPTNIASNEKLDPIDYIFNPKTKTAYFLNPILWHKFIYKHNLLASYEQFLNRLNAKQQHRQYLFDWLISKNYIVEDIASVIKYKLYADVNINNPETLNRIITHTKLSDGSVYIPGSSIKGLIRTAILFDLLQKHTQLKSRLWQKIICLKNATNRYYMEKDLSFISSELEKNLLKTIKISDRDFLDIMSGIKISDSISDDNLHELILLKKYDISMITASKIKENDISVFRECIREKARFYFDMQIDTSITKKVDINSADDILAKLDAFFIKVNNIFKNSFGKTYLPLSNETNLGNAYLGGGTGFLTKTLLAMIAPNPEDAVYVIKKWLDLKHGKHKNDSKISPRTLKTIKYNQQQKLQGIVKISKV